MYCSNCVFAPTSSPFCGKYAFASAKGLHPQKKPTYTIAPRRIRLKRSYTWFNAETRKKFNSSNPHDFSKALRFYPFTVYKYIRGSCRSPSPCLLSAFSSLTLFPLMLPSRSITGLPGGTKDERTLSKTMFRRGMQLQTKCYILVPDRGGGRNGKRGFNHSDILVEGFCYLLFSHSLVNVWW